MELNRENPPPPDGARGARNLSEIEALGRSRLEEAALAYLAGGADDARTTELNRTDFSRIGIRARRLVDVEHVDTTVELLGRTHRSPIVLAPVGFQQLFHPDGEIATARAAAARGSLMIQSSVSSFSVAEVTDAAGAAPWFQLYPTPDREVTRALLRRAEAAGCEVVVLTVDVPVLGNRETHGITLLEMMHDGGMRLGNYEGLVEGPQINDPSMTWRMIGWLRESCGMKVVLKGIMTHEDTALAVEHGVDGIVVSNHGGRQEESDLSAIACLPEVVEAGAGKLSILVDGGIRRGTDVFKALALGADAVCVGRPQCYGLAAAGRHGVERVLEILEEELGRTMQLAGAPRLRTISRGHVRPPEGWFRGPQ